MLFILVFSLCACNRQELVVVDSPAPESTDDVSSPETDETGKIGVTLYRGDSNAEYILPVECEIDELSPAAILDMLCELGVFSQPVTANSLTIDENNVVHLDMDSSFASLIQSTGTAGERIMLGSLVNSILSAYDAHSVLISVDGGTLESGHDIYDYELTFFEN